MSILDQTAAPIDPTGTVAQGVSALRHELEIAVQFAETATTCMKDMCDKHTRAAVDTELGGDSPEFANIYTSLKTFLDRGNKFPRDVSTGDLILKLQACLFFIHW